MWCCILVAKLDDVEDNKSDVDDNNIATTSSEGSSASAAKLTSNRRKGYKWHNMAYNIYFVYTVTECKRSRVQGRVMEIVKEFSKQNGEAEKRFYEFEEKRMKLEAKLEADRRKREDEHELQLQEMFTKSLQQMMHSPTFGSFPPTFASPYGRPMQYSPRLFDDDT